MKKKLIVGGTLVALAAGLGVGSVVLGKKASVQAAGVVAPRFEVDPMWPQPLPNHWIIGQTIGLDVDTKDNVWIIHRRGSVEAKESYAMTTPPSAECCIAAPDVLEFDAAGKLIRSWTDPKTGNDWPASNHGISVNPKTGNVWLGANGGGAPPAAAAGRGPGRAASGTAPAAGINAPEAGVARAGAVYHDAFMLEFTQDGKFIKQIGKANMSKGSNDTENVKGVAEIRFNDAGELIAADGYGNKRVSVWNPETGKYIRHWGAFGVKDVSDAAQPAYVPGDAPNKQFRNPVHCAVPSSDGLVYVCDRVNDRMQVFKEDGTFVKEINVLPNTRGDGSVWEVAFSKDKAQKFLYMVDGSNERIHIFDRLSLTELTAFGDGGRQPGQFYAAHSIATNSKGDIFTTETYRGQRVQKFVYKGLGPVTAAYVPNVWPKKK